MSKATLEMRSRKEGVKWLAWMKNKYISKSSYRLCERYMCGEVIGERKEK